MLIKYLDDIFVTLGCLLILAGTYAVCPVATWFVAGAMFIGAGVLVGMGQKGSKT